MVSASAQFEPRENPIIAATATGDSIDAELVGQIDVHIVEEGVDDESRTSRHMFSKNTPARRSTLSAITPTDAGGGAGFELTTKAAKGPPKLRSMFELRQLPKEHTSEDVL